jgi:hypothetical protein
MRERRSRRITRSKYRGVTSSNRFGWKRSRRAGRT